jgi:hypothetical protein
LFQKESEKVRDGMSACVDVLAAFYILSKSATISVEGLKRIQKQAHFAVRTRGYTLWTPSDFFMTGSRYFKSKPFFVEKDTYKEIPDL